MKKECSIQAKQLLNEAQEMMPRLVTWRRQIHRHPEIGLTLPHTRAVVEEALDALSVPHRRVGADETTGVVGLIKGNRPGPTILLRADMDALPLQEDNTLPYRSEIDGAAHMCGHDTHTAMLLGAAALLSAHRDAFVGSVKLMFQPGEEGYNGALRMIEDGLLEDPRPDAALAMHCLTGSHWKTGTLLCATGLKAKASSDTFSVTVRGRGTHGATPEHGTDVIRVMTQIVDGLYAIRSRELSPFVPAILSVCQFHAGAVDNILPEEGTLSGTFRTFDEEIQAQIRRRIKEIAVQTAAAFGVTATVSFGESLRPTINDPALCADVFSYLQELAGTDGTDIIGPVMGAEDFSEVSRLIPSTYIDISFGSTEDGYPYAVHSPRCLFDENAMPIGAACHAWCAIRWLLDHETEKTGAAR